MYKFVCIRVYFQFSILHIETVNKTHLPNLFLAQALRNFLFHLMTNSTFIFLVLVAKLRKVNKLRP